MPDGGLISRMKRWLRAEDVADAEDEKDEQMFTRAETRIIVGLGNPGKQYAQTRHNAGWMVIDELAKRSFSDSPRNRLQAELTEVRYKGYRVVLAKPQTFMNDSGRAVREMMNWYKVGLSDVLVITDDLDIAFGRLKLRPNGSPGGHNGLKSIIRETGSEEFPRLRFGIGRPQEPGKPTVNHVLSKFSPDEERQLPIVINAAADAVDGWLDDGLLATMNAVNGQPTVLSET